MARNDSIFFNFALRLIERYFRQPEMISVVTVGWKAHPISTCGAFGGVLAHPTVAHCTKQSFLYLFCRVRRARLCLRFGVCPSRHFWG